MPLPKCETCQFWDHEENWTSGECRRFAPRAVIETVTADKPPRFAARWPETDALDGCGEHRPIPSNDAPIPYGRMTDGPIA